mmetsp:Transcript_55853/g.100453  ORF Transcript_55853/g.100453 Transcript_55853/m.100453 type:complete len:107 (+) Transcript_55853:370-690(+)
MQKKRLLAHTAPRRLMKRQSHCWVQNLKLLDEEMPQPDSSTPSAKQKGAANALHAARRARNSNADGFAAVRVFLYCTRGWLIEVAIPPCEMSRPDWPKSWQASRPL